MRNKKFICPYCFTESKLKEIEFRCQNPSCITEPDEKYSQFRDIRPALRMRHIIKTNLTKKKLKCDQCNEDSTDRICPHCHTSLPYTIGEFEDFTFAIIGAKASGKSHYIAVLINELKKNIGRLFKTDLQAVDDETVTKYKTSFYNHIFEKQETIPETKSARSNRDVKTPMVYNLKIRGNSLFKKNKIKDVVTISFFDTAGEDLDSKNNMSTTNKYIYHSKGIILLIDPLQVGEIRNEVKTKGIKLPEQFTEPAEIITRVAGIIRENNSIPMNKKIDIPIAVAFTKIDVLPEVIDTSGYNFFNPSGHKGFFDKKDADSIHSNIEILLNDWDGIEFLNNLQADFNHYGFFGLTALGSNPGNPGVEIGKIPKLRPHRVADPFLWLLKEHRLIKAK